MENQERDMGSIDKEKNEIKRHSKDKERLTIMIFKKAGKVRTIKLSPGLMLWAFLFFLFYIVASIFLTNAYFNAYRTNKIQAEKITKLTKELIKTKKNFERSKQHIALLDDYIRQGKEQTPEPMSKVDYTEPPFPKLVDIDELKVTRDRSALHVNFKIVNKQSTEEPIGGYIFVMASEKDSQKSEVWIYPNAPLKDGIPMDYRRGHRFFIQRFKTVTGTYNLNKSTGSPLILEILVYDRNGKLLLKKVVEV